MQLQSQYILNYFQKSVNIGWKLDLSLYKRSIFPLPTPSIDQFRFSFSWSIHFNVRNITRKRSRDIVRYKYQSISTNLIIYIIYEFFENLSITTRFINFTFREIVRKRCQDFVLSFFPFKTLRKTLDSRMINSF